MSNIETVTIVRIVTIQNLFFYRFWIKELMMNIHTYPHKFTLNIYRYKFKIKYLALTYEDHSDEDSFSSETERSLHNIIYEVLVTYYL